MINIAELLKDAPEGMKLYSPLFGDVEYCYIGGTNRRIWVCTKASMRMFSMDGRYCFTHDGNTIESTECLLFPSKECRTWEGWKATVEPKFKVGDSLQSGSYFTKILSINLEEERYYCDNRIISFKNQDLWHLVPKHHYDISNFQPFDKVLVRQNDSFTWGLSFFGRYCGMFMCCNNACFTQCIPYNDDTEHLLGTTDMPSEEFINW